jgi:hypothetical protein
MSGYPENEALQRVACGSYRFIKKPFAPPQLVKAVQSTFATSLTASVG